MQRKTHISPARELFPAPNIQLRHPPGGANLTDEALVHLKYYYWAKSITGSKKLVWKTIKTLLFFIGTAGLNAFTQEKILGHHPDTQLSEPCTKLISEGVGMPLGALLPIMVFLGLCTCFMNAISRAKALGSDNEGFGAMHLLTEEQKRRLHDIDRAFQTLILFPDGENVFYISEKDKAIFGLHFQQIMNLMSAKYAKFHIVSNQGDLEKILTSNYTNGTDRLLEDWDLSNTPLLSTQSRNPKYNVILFDGATISTRQILTPTYRLIPINVTNNRFQRKHFWQEMKRIFWNVGFGGHAYRLWCVFLWVLFKGFPGLQIIFQINKALTSLEEAVGLSWKSHWALQFTLFAFNMAVAWNRVFINNEMKGNEIYYLMEKRTVQKKYQLPADKKQWLPFLKAVIVSFVPIVVTILYLAFTSLFFASAGPIVLGRQISGIFPKDWVQRLTPSTDFINFFLNFITYGAMITGLATGIPTQCRAIYTELYRYFSKPNKMTVSRSCCTSIVWGQMLFYITTFFDSGQFGLNAFYNAMQAMLDPQHLFITNALGACQFALVLSIAVGIGIAVTSMAWSKYTGDKKYKSFVQLFRKDSLQIAGKDTMEMDEAKSLELDGLSSIVVEGEMKKSGSSSSLSLLFTDSRMPQPQDRLSPPSPKSGLFSTALN